MTDRSRLPELPTAMAARAKWARMTACDDPTKIEIDNEYLPWIYCQEDDLWYSFDGNYSGISPEDKRIKALEWEKKKSENEAKAHERALVFYEENLYWSKVREDVLDRDNYSCQLCGKNGNGKLHIHHILKRRQGGSDHYDNLITACPKCHKQADSSLYDPEYDKE